VRAAIEAFTRPGDLILDPHVGGGTTLVEALALRRDALGIDISELAEFVSSVKTMVLSESELDRLSAWARGLKTAVDIRGYSFPSAFYLEHGYYKHLNHPARWRLRKAIEQAIGSAICLQSRRLEAFGRCVVLRTAQWALDGRKKLPSFAEFRIRLMENAIEMIEGARELRLVARAHPTRPSIRIVNRSSIGLDSDPRLADLPAPRLVLTSPPYPGIHVLYHRWQVDGRKEAPAPFWIADKLDGAGSSYYTMGDRKFPELRTYFDNLRATMRSVAALCNNTSMIVQMVAFSEPSWQLPRYLETLREVGLSEVLLPVLERVRDGRLWRTVPNRRWYSDQRGETPGSQEVVLFHRKDRLLTQSRPPARRLPRSPTDPQGQGSSEPA
jgi:hypothetical protein